MADKQRQSSTSTLGDTARAYGNAAVQTARDFIDPSRNPYVRNEASRLANDARAVYNRYKQKRSAKRGSSR